MDKEVGKSYFGGLIRMNHVQFYKFLMYLEVLQIISSIVHSAFMHFMRGKGNTRLSAHEWSALTF